MEAPPVLRGHVAEAELREALLDGQVEESLRETDQRGHRREEAEPLEAEHPRRGDRAEDAEGDREIEPGCGRDTAPENARGHRDGSVYCRPQSTNPQERIRAAGIPAHGGAHP